MGNKAALGGVYVHTILPVALVSPYSGAMVPNSTFLSIDTLTPAIGAPVPSINVAVICVVSVGRMTGFVVDRFSVAMGAGGPTVIVTLFVAVAVDVPWVAVAVMRTSPSTGGTFQLNPAWPPLSVVPVRVWELLPNTAFKVTEAPLTGTLALATMTSTGTVAPNLTRPGTVIATEETPVVGGIGGVTRPAGARLTRDQ